MMVALLLERAHNLLLLLLLITLVDKCIYTIGGEA
jgi:hypothetical protein